jgi:hypothetical protein
MRWMIERIRSLGSDGRVSVLINNSNRSYKNTYNRLNQSRIDRARRTEPKLADTAITLTRMSKRDGIRRMKSRSRLHGFPAMCDRRSLGVAALPAPPLDAGVALRRDGRDTLVLQGLLHEAGGDVPKRPATASVPPPVSKPGLQSDTLRVQAVLTDILHDAEHPRRVCIVDDMNQVGLVQTMAYRDHASFMPDFVFDGLEGALVKGFVNMHKEISGLHEVLLVTVCTCSHDPTAGGPYKEAGLPCKRTAVCRASESGQPAMPARPTMPSC